jgi:DNA polymerase III alpha subunit
VPRIDRKVIQQYKEDIIVLSGNLNGEIPNKILNLGENQAEEIVVEGTVPGRLLYGGDASQSRG